jgi:hypothetical protein
LSKSGKTKSKYPLQFFVHNNIRKEDTMHLFKKSLGSMLLGVALVGGLATASFAPQAAFAQLTGGNIVGTVVDASGAALAKAKVEIVNIATGVTVVAVTDNNGEFTAQNLLPGKYNISASASGFNSYELKDFELKLNENASARLALPIASTAATVEVSSEASVTIDTTTTQLATTFETKEISDLPTASVGLGVLNLSLLTPGVSSSGAVGAGTGPSVGGQRPRANNYTIEGIDNNNKSVTGPLVYIPNDAVGDFTLITNQFSPEFGHSAGGQFNTNIRSGTNKFHGAAYEYFQNRDLNAENAIQGGKIPNPRYDFNRYGGEVGGPIIPNKLFFFGNYERQTTGQSGQYYLCTPTAAGFAALGTVANLSATNLGIYTKYVPVSPSQIDASADNACFNQSTGPESLTVYDGTKLNSDTGEFASGNATVIPLGNYLVSAPVFTNFDALTTGFDYTLSSKDSLRGRYIYNTEGTQDTAAALPAFFQAIPDRFHLISISEYHNFSPNLTNEARIGFNRYYNATPSGNFAFPGVDSFPNIEIFDQNDLNIGPDGNAPQSTIQNMYQFTDNISWVKGKHTLKFGFDGRKFISPQSFTQRVRGDYQYDNLTEYLHDLAPTAFGERSTGNFFYYGDQTAWYGYANDTWKATPKLSLNFGVRYEFTSVPVGERAQVLNISASVPGLILFATPKPQYNNYAPRVGIVYAPDENTSIRAGFGMAYDVLYDNLGTLSFPPQYSSTQDVGSGAPGVPNYGDPNFLANGGLPPGKGTLATFDTIADQRAATSAQVADQKLPYAETWSLGVEHVFHRDYTLEVRYLGTRGIHLPSQIQLNRVAKVDSQHFLPTYIGSTPSDAELAALPYTLATLTSRSAYAPGYAEAGFTGKITSFQPKSESNYNGLAVNLTRRFQKGLQVNLAYTWSKTMDDATADVFSTTLTPRRPQDFQNIPADYSRSALDHTHRLTFEAVYDLPFFKNSNWLVKNVVGNWEVAPIYTYESPEYFTTLSGDDANLNGDGAYIDRPIVNPNGKHGTGTGVSPIYDPNRAIACGEGVATCNGNLVAYVAADPNAQYVQAGSGALATAGRNTLPINPINNLDATAVKRFSFTERYKLEFQAQAYNVLNHAQYLPGTLDNINSPGYTTSLNFQTVTTAEFNTPGKAFAANARTMQLALKFTF